MGWKLGCDQQELGCQSYATYATKIETSPGTKWALPHNQQTTKVLFPSLSRLMSVIKTIGAWQATYFLSSCFARDQGHVSPSADGRQEVWHQLSFDWWSCTRIYGGKIYGTDGSSIQCSCFHSFGFGTGHQWWMHVLDRLAVYKWKPMVNRFGMVCTIHLSSFSGWFVIGFTTENCLISSVNAWKDDTQPKEFRCRYLSWGRALECGVKAFKISVNTFW